LDVRHHGYRTCWSLGLPHFVFNIRLRVRFKYLDGFWQSHGCRASIGTAYYSRRKITFASLKNQASLAHCERGFFMNLINDHLASMASMERFNGGSV
jgi:hypothetical protein